jgi:hypothetical protein
VRLLLLVGVAAYGALLLGTSLGSRERILARGETLRFCGFYLDCHLGLTVEGVDRRDTLQGVRARGEFYVVRLRVSSDARRATLRPTPPVFAVVDADGTHYPPAEHLDTGPRRMPPLPAGGSHTMEVVFDLPREIREPRLRVRSTRGIERFLEAVLVGDDDSILHRPAVLALN